MKTNLPCAFWRFAGRVPAKRSPSRPDILGERTVTLDGQLVSYTLKRSSRARCVRFEVREGTGLAVVVPRSYRLRGLNDLLKEKQRWILHHLAGHFRATQLLAAGEVRSGDTVPYLGRDLGFVKCPADGCAPGVGLVQNQLVIRGALDRQRMDLLLEQWYRSQALQFTRRRVDELVHRLGVQYGRITIRGQRTRWGSCSHRGALSFNWRLMMAPEPVIDYVIIHEVAHLREMNHTARFWKLVAEECPGWREHRQWLNEHGGWLNARPLPQQPLRI